MGKTLKYVKDFEFPADKGYSGSAGQQMVKGYARGGSCGPMKKADGGIVERESVRFIPAADAGKFMRALGRGTLPSMVRGIARDMALSDFEEEGRRALDESRAERASRLMGEKSPRVMRSQGLRSPVAEMAREEAMEGYKKGGMAMRKQYPTNRSEPMISGPKAAPAPKKDMLFSKKEVNAKTLLRDGKAPPMPHAKGSVNMKSGGPVKKAMGGAMPVNSAPAAAPTGSQAQRAMQAAQIQQQNQRVQQESRARNMQIQQQNQRIQQESKMRNQQVRQQPMPMPKPGQVGSATGSTPNIGGFPSQPAPRRPLPMSSPNAAMAKGGQAKVGKVMGEFKEGKLHSGSKSGPVVKSRKQALAIGISEARKAKK